MKVQVISSIPSDCTRRLAEGTFNGLNVADKAIHDLKDDDVILLDYWTDKSSPTTHMKTPMESLYE